MIQLRDHASIDYGRWDEAIDRCPYGLVYAKSWYLDLVAPGWLGLVEDDYQSVFPLTARKKAGIHYLFQPFFTQQLGLFAGSSPSAEKVNRFLEQLPSYFRLVEIQLNHANRASAAGFKIFERPTNHLDLRGTYESKRKGYSENLLRNLKRAEQQGLEITRDFSTADLIGIFRSNRGQEVDTLKDRDYALLEKLCTEAERRGLITRAGVALHGRLEAGAIFLHSNHEYIFLFSATGIRARETGAMPWIIDRFIQEHTGQEMVLDFEGSVDPGLARFYKSFGSKEVVYLQLRKNKLPLPLRWFK